MKKIILSLSIALGFGTMTFADVCNISSNPCATSCSIPSAPCPTSKHCVTKEVVSTDACGRSVIKTTESSTLIDGSPASVWAPTISKITNSTACSTPCASWVTTTCAAPAVSCEVKAPVSCC